MRSKQIEVHEKRNICDACKDCPDNEQIISHCFGECYWPIDVMYEIEDKRYQEAADGHNKNNDKC